MSLLQTLFSCVLLWISCARSQTPELTPQVGSVSAGQSFTFNCNVGVKDTNGMAFLRQSPGEPPQAIFTNYHGWSSPIYGPGMSSDHFTGTINSAGTEYLLIIKETTIADTSLYYCVKWYTSLSAFVFSEKSKLIVTVDKFSPPVLNVFKPFSEELSTKDKLMMTCHATKLTVSLANVSWQVDGTTVQEGVSTSQPVREPDNTFSLSSYMTISPDDLSKDKVISCWVQQEGSSAFTSQGVRLSQC
ncbi:immunoglobulin lambda-1 light chain-like isoform 2-T2 [Discoglossus pictus]